ncbi:hypothetical protein E2562_004130, partial [Oryza meyeriana var. granulata]
AVPLSRSSLCRPTPSALGSSGSGGGEPCSSRSGEGGAREWRLRLGDREGDRNEG